MRKIIAIDPQNCNGCRVCEMICSLHRQKECNPERSQIRVIRQEIDGEVQIRETGVPTRATLERLGLKEVADDLGRTGEAGEPREQRVALTWLIDIDRFASGVSSNLKRKRDV